MDGGSILSSLFAGTSSNKNRVGRPPSSARPASARPPPGGDPRPGSGRPGPPYPLPTGPQRGSVHNLDRPALFSNFNRPVSSTGLAPSPPPPHPQRPFRPTPGDDEEPEIVTAPSTWNMIVSSSLTGQASPPKPALPSGQLSHRAGYVIDAAEESPEPSDNGNSPPVAIAEDGLLQHQDSPSRLGIAIDYDTAPPKKSGSAESGDYYEDYEDYPVSPVAIPRNKTRGGPPPYGVNLGDLSESDEHIPPSILPSASAEHELEGFGAAFPELVGNGIRKRPSSTTRPPVTRKPTTSASPTVVDQAIDAYDKRFRTVEVDSVSMPVNTTTLPTNEDKSSNNGKINVTSGSGLTYLLIGILGGISLLFFCAVGLTIRCRKRRFRFTTFTTMLRRRGGMNIDEESSVTGGSPTPNSVSARRIANQQAVMSANSKEAEVSTHKLGSWFTGRNSMSSLHSHQAGQESARKLRSEMALPSALSTVGTASGKRIVTRAYFTDGRTGSTRDLVTSASDTSGGSTPGTPGPPHRQLPDRKSWLHSSYTKDRGNSLNELRDSSFYCISAAAAPTTGGSSDEAERPRSASATVRSPIHHFRASGRSQLRLQDSLESCAPPDLPPKRRSSHHLDSVTVDPMGSHLTLATDADGSVLGRSDVAVSYWGATAAGNSNEDRLI